MVKYQRSFVTAARALSTARPLAHISVSAHAMVTFRALSTANVSAHTAATASAATAAPTKLKKFWKTASIKETSLGFNILLDGKALKTPSGSILTLPLEKKNLTFLTAVEWELQDSVLKSYSLPLTSIVMRSLDSLNNPVIRSGVIESLLAYVHTDSICYQQDYPESFVKLQAKYWTPIIEWIEKRFNLEIKTTDGILRIKQSDKVIQKFRDIIEGYDNIKLAAFEKAVLRSKSFMIGLTVVEREFSVDFASSAARLEVMHQIDRWGEVEDSHDLDREDIKRQLGSVVAAII